jgi:hypothetical protein
MLLPLKYHTHFNLANFLLLLRNIQPKFYQINRFRSVNYNNISCYNCRKKNIMQLHIFNLKLIEEIMNMNMMITIIIININVIILIIIRKFFYEQKICKLLY